MKVTPALYALFSAAYSHLVCVWLFMGVATSSLFSGNKFLTATLVSFNNAASSCVYYPIHRDVEGLAVTKVTFAVSQEAVTFRKFRIRQCTNVPKTVTNLRGILAIVQSPVLLNSWEIGVHYLGVSKPKKEA